jgi:hypothetical protein
MRAVQDRHLNLRAGASEMTPVPSSHRDMHPVRGVIEYDTRHATELRGEAASREAGA